PVHSVYGLLRNFVARRFWAELDCGQREVTRRKRIMKAVIVSLALGVALVAGAQPVGAVAANAAVKADSSRADQIEARVHRDATLKGHRIKATVEGGVATLTGTVATESQKAKAARLAHVKGITRVDNQIVVDRSAAANNSETIGTKAGKGIDKSKNAAE